jgi:hypothetical protein
MQDRPIGANTALYRDPTTEALTRQYKQQRSDYNMARRLLSRQARRGDEKAAMSLIELGKDAAKEGISFGMQNPDQRNAEIARRRMTLEQKTQDELNFKGGGAEAGAGGGGAGNALPTGAGAGNALATGRGMVNLPESAVGVSSFDDELNGTQVSLGTELGQRAGFARQRLLNPAATTERGAKLDLDKVATQDESELKFRQGLDRALGMAKTEQEINELRQVGESAGIAPEAFKRRQEWWSKRR